MCLDLAVRPQPHSQAGRQNRGTEKVLRNQYQPPRAGARFRVPGPRPLPPGHQVEDLRPGVGDRVGQPRRDVDQGAVAGNDPLPDLAGGGFPGDDAAAVEGVEPFRVAGVEVVAPAVARVDGNEVEGRQQVHGGLKPPLPGEKAHAPGVGLDCAAQIDELNFCHPVSLLVTKSSRFKVQAGRLSQIRRGRSVAHRTCSV